MWIYFLFMNIYAFDDFFFIFVLDVCMPFVHLSSEYNHIISMKCRFVQQNIRFVASCVQYGIISITVHHYVLKEYIGSAKNK